ncbi:MAG: hypothetical protein ACRCXL_07610 [Dermatophilaceae bacterium]
MTCRAAEPYAASAHEMDAGVVDDIAMATDAGSDGTPVGSAPSSTETPLDQLLALSLTVIRAAASVVARTDPSRPRGLLRSPPGPVRQSC